MAKEELQRGKLSSIILSTLLDTDKYGYEIIEEIKQKTNNSLVIKQPSLYSCLKRMEDQNLISSYWRDSDIGGRRHYYSITDYGKKYAEKWNNESLEEGKNKQGNEPKTIILQQGNVFDINKTEQKPQIIEEKKEEQVKAYVQYDLFTKPQVCEPSDEVFDCIKKLRDDANEEKIVSINNNIEELRYKNNEGILTTYESQNYKANGNSNNNIFWEYRKNKKSFAQKLREQPIQFVDESSSEDVEIQQINEDILDNTEQPNSQNNTQNTNFENIDSFDQKSKTYYHSTILHEEKEIEENSVNTQFIDLDNIQTNDVMSEKNDKIEDNQIFEQENIETNEENIENTNIYQTKQIDSAILINEHIENIPKVKKIAPARFENIRINTEENIIDQKLMEKQKEIESISNEITQEQEPIIYNKIENINNFETLKTYYDSCGIKFGVYSKSRTKQNNKKENRFFTLVCNISLFAIVILETILLFSFNKSSQSEWNWLYLALPLLVLGLLAYKTTIDYIGKHNLLENIGQKIMSTWFVLITSIIVCILFLFGINLICGIQLDNISTYITTFIYPTIILVNILPYKLMNDVLK